MMKRDFRKGIFGQLHISWDRLEVLWAPRQPTTFSTKFLIMVAPLGVWVTWKPFIQGWDGNTSCLYIYIYKNYYNYIYILCIIRVTFYYILLTQYQQLLCWARNLQAPQPEVETPLAVPSLCTWVSSGFHGFSWVLKVIHVEFHVFFFNGFNMV